MAVDGNSLALWRSGQLVGKIHHLDGDVVTAGSKLRPSVGLLGTIESFLRWKPLPPKTPRQLAEISARLCRLMREEVGEQLQGGDPNLTEHAQDWRNLLFPEATDEEFADGYAQAVPSASSSPGRAGSSLTTGSTPPPRNSARTTR